MNEKEFVISPPLIRNLLRAQFPHWAALEITEVPSGGTDNVMCRLGRELVVRLPRAAATIPTLEKEQAWLPRLEQALPIAVPRLVARGQASPDYPAPWSINAWIEGATYREDAVTDWDAFVQALTTFVHALQSIDITGAPTPGRHNFGRGAPLATRDLRVRAALDAAASWLDIDAARAAWDEDSRSPEWPGPPRWIHGDIHANNILLSDGRLHAVIDFGGLGVGDPACELALAWRLLPSRARPQFRTLIGPDVATWRRARAWALSISLMEVLHYRTSNPVLTAIAVRTIGEVLRDRMEGQP